MAHKNTPAEELYEVAVLLLASVKSFHKALGGKWPTMDKLILRAEAALKARPQ